MPAGHDAFHGNGHSPTGEEKRKKRKEERKEGRVDGEDGEMGREGEWLNGWRVVLCVI